MKKKLTWMIGGTLVAMTMLPAFAEKAQADTCDAPKVKPAAVERGKGKARQPMAELELTEEQREKVKQLMQEQHKLREQMQKEMQELRAKHQAQKESHQKKLQEILTPEQYQKLEEMKKRRAPSRMRQPEKGKRQGEEKAEVMLESGRIRRRSGK